jgi:hypothetical protein
VVMTRLFNKRHICFFTRDESFTHSLPWHQTEMSGQLHDPNDSLLENIGFWRRWTSLAPTGIQTPNRLAPRLYLYPLNNPGPQLDAVRRLNIHKTSFIRCIHIIWYRFTLRGLPIM